jgi:pyridoxal phosphate enzyme (YggS family)
MSLQENLHQVQDRINSAAARAGRDPALITLVAVSKTQPVESLIEAYHLGVRHFGENRVEEASIKIPAFKQIVADPSVTFHMIGHVQSRKAAEVVALFDRVHSIDSVKLAHRLDRFAAEQHKLLPILLEVNVSGEESKYGLDGARRIELLGAIQTIGQLPNLKLDGLMTMAPIVDRSDQARPVFRALREVRDEIEAKVKILLPQLSMGMTDDFEVAIEEGATWIRVGRAIFGERVKTEGEK